MSRTIHLLAAGLVAVLFAAGCQRASAPTEMATAPPDPAGVNAVRDAYVAAYNRGDAAGVAALYASDAVALPDHHELVEGPAAIEAYLQGVFEQYSPTLAVTTRGSQIFQDWAYDYGTYSLTMEPGTGGNAMMEEGKYLVILRYQQDGSWKIYRDINNTSAPPMAP